jgi:anti-sigma-K factor RskA
MTGHDQFAEDLPLYALGALEAEQRTALENHLRDCNACRRELQQLEGDMALLSLSATGPAPPARSRPRLMSAIANEPRTRAVAERRRSWAWIPVLAAIIFAALTLFFWRDRETWKQRYAQLQQTNQQNAAQVEHAREVMALFTGPDALHVTLTAANVKPEPHGKALYRARDGMLMFIAGNLAPLPPDKAYELWLVPMKGAPMPAGMFKPDARGNAMVMNPPMPKGMEAKAFAVTIEPEAGSATPTMPMVMSGAGE